MNNIDRLFDYEHFFARGQLSLPSADIIQIAELSLIKGGEISEHTQYCDEITYVISGKATVYSGDSSFTITAGHIHYLKQGHYHRIVADQDQHFHFCCIGFVPNPEYESTRGFFQRISDIQHFHVKDEGSIQNVFQLLVNEFYLPDVERNVMIHLYFCQILILLYRMLIGTPQSAGSKISASSSSNAVYHTMKYIDRHFIELTSVREIAKELSYSEFYLSHIFKEKMNTTIKDYLLQKKILTATELLKNSNMSISEISDHLNFSSLSVFGAAFKRYMHISPSQFRKNNTFPFSQ